MRKKYSKLFLGFLMAASFGTQAQDITIEFANAQQTQEGVDVFYEADLMISSTVDFKLGDGQVYLNYDPTYFGNNLVAAGGVTFDHGPSSSSDGTYILDEGNVNAAAAAIYSNISAVDNTSTRISFSFIHQFGASNIAANNVTSTPSKLMRIKMRYADPGNLSAVGPCFETNPAFLDLFYTACGDTGPFTKDCTGTPGTQLVNDTLDCTNSDPTPLSIGGVDLDNSKFTLYPNPSKGEFMVEGLESEANISIYSLSGKQLISLEGFNGGEVNISTLSTGMYLVSIESNDAKAVKRLMVK